MSRRTTIRCMRLVCSTSKSRTVAPRSSAIRKRSVSGRSRRSSERRTTRRSAVLATAAAAGCGASPRRMAAGAATVAIGPRPARRRSGSSDGAGQRAGAEEDGERRAEGDEAVGRSRRRGLVAGLGDGGEDGVVADVAPRDRATGLARSTSTDTEQGNLGDVVCGRRTQCVQYLCGTVYWRVVHVVGWRRLGVDGWVEVFMGPTRSGVVPVRARKTLALQAGSPAGPTGRAHDTRGMRGQAGALAVTPLNSLAACGTSD